MSSGPRAGARATLIWVFLLSLLHLGQTLPLLTRVPRAIMDESWEACTGYALATEGRLRNPVIRERAGIDRAFVQPRVVQSVALAATYKLLGVSLASGRLASVLVGLAAVLGTFYLLRTWFPHWVAGLGAVLLLTETRFFMVTHMVRPEAHMVCVSVWMLALLARGIERGRYRLCLAAGLVGGVGCYTHPNVVLCVPVAAAVLFLGLGLGRRSLGLAGGSVLGGALALVPFVAWVVYAHGEYGVSFIEQLGEYHTDVGAEPLADTLQREASRWAGYLRVAGRGPWVIAVAVGGLAAILRRHRVQTWALAMVFGHLAMMPLVIRRGSPMYLTVLSPWLSVLIVVGAYQLWQYATEGAATPWRQRGLRLLVLGVLVMALANCAVANGYLVYAYRGADYDAVCERIAAHIPPGSRVFGRLLFWTGLHDYPYLCDMNQEAGCETHVERVLVAELIKFKPQYVVWNTDPCWCIGGTGPRNLDPQRTVVYEDGTMRVLIEKVVRERLRPRAVTLDEFETHDFGRISVYRVRR